jgi:hypothetical protein
MSNYVTPRSVSKLEAELAELEKGWEASQSGGDEEEEGETGEEVQDTSPPAPAPKPEAEPEDEEEKSWKKRHGDERRRNQKLADDLKAAQEALKQAQRQQASPGLPTAEEAEAWAKANPKAAAIIRGLVADEVSSNKDELVQIKTKLDRAEQLAMILEAHPDFKQVTHNDNIAFHKWAEAQPQFVQDRIYGSGASAEDVIWAISQYKEKTAEKPNLKKEAAKAVSSKSSVEVKTETKGRFSESQVNKMSMQEYEKNADAIAEAMRSGNFVYDLSGAAR